MSFYRNKRKRLPLWILLTLTAVLLLSISFNQTLGLKKVLTIIISPAVNIFGITIDKISDIKYGFTTRKDLLRENKLLREQLNNVTMQLNRYKETALENDRLIKLIDFKKKKEYSVVPASVIGRDPLNWFESILIDKGTSHGIKKDMPVVTADGLVGRISEAAPSFSKVLLIIDNDSRVGAMIQDTRYYGILEGTSSSICTLNYLSRDASFKLADQVVTSGMGTVYPKGLVVGRVTKISSENYGLYKSAEVQPACDFSKIEEVLVLVVMNKNDEKQKSKNK